jgi:hypothetical protein
MITLGGEHILVLNKWGRLSAPEELTVNVGRMPTS